MYSKIALGFAVLSLLLLTSISVVTLDMKLGLKKEIFIAAIFFFFSMLFGGLFSILSILKKEELKGILKIAVFINFSLVILFLGFLFWLNFAFNH